MKYEKRHYSDLKRERRRGWTPAPACKRIMVNLYIVKAVKNWVNASKPNMSFSIRMSSEKEALKEAKKYFTEQAGFDFKIVSIEVR